MGDVIDDMRLVLVAGLAMSLILKPHPYLR